MFRKPIHTSQCIEDGEIVNVVTCDDGSMWRFDVSVLGCWIRIPDIPQPTVEEVVGVIVGVCKDCGRMITEDQKWIFSTKEGWSAHDVVEDCEGASE